MQLCTVILMSSPDFCNVSLFCKICLNLGNFLSKVQNVCGIVAEVFQFLRKCCYCSSSGDTAGCNPSCPALTRGGAEGCTPARGWRPPPVVGTQWWVRSDRFFPFFLKFSAKFACFRLYRHRSLQVKRRFAAFFKIYQII